MALRREDGGRSVATVEEAKLLALETKERAERLKATPGLLDGSLAEIHGALERVLREYPRVSRRRRSSFTRDLDGIAKRAQDLREEGRLSPRHAKFVGLALQHTRRIHFWNARRVLAKLDKALEPVRGWQEALDAYRTFHRKASLRVRDAEAELARQRSVPRPPVGPEEVAKFRALVEACNRAVDDAWVAQTHRPALEAIRDLVAHPDVDGLGLLYTQELACLRELGDFLETDAGLRDSIGARPLAELVTTSEYSVAKWDRVYPQAAHERRKLQDLFHQLRPVVTGAHGTPFAGDAPVTDLQRRVAAWRTFPTGARTTWDDLVSLLESATVPLLQEAARAYDRFGELAVRAWDGRLAREIQDQEAELRAARKDFSALPGPDTLLP